MTEENKVKQTIRFQREDEMDEGKILNFKVYKNGRLSFYGNLLKYVEE